MFKAGSIIINRKKEEILLGLQAKNHSWGIPKGKIEEGETLEECSKRELMEEICLEFSDEPFSFIDVYHIRCFIYERDVDVAHINSCLSVRQEKYSSDSVMAEMLQVKWFPMYKVANMCSYMPLLLKTLRQKLGIDHEQYRVNHMLRFEKPKLIEMFDISPDAEDDEFYEKCKFHICPEHDICDKETFIVKSDGQNVLLTKAKLFINVTSDCKYQDKYDELIETDTHVIYVTQVKKAYIPIEVNPKFPKITNEVMEILKKYYK